MDDGAASDQQRGLKQSAAIFGLVVIAALIPRAIGLDFALPVIVHPDELEPVGRAQELVATHGGIEDWMAWRYPPLLAELLVLDQKLRPLDVHDLSGQIMRGRWLSMILGALAAGFVALAGRRVGLPNWAAILAGLVLALCPLALRLSRYATPDSLMIAMVALGVWASAKLAIAGRWREYLLAGLSIGLAASAKYNAALIVVMIVVVHLLTRPRELGAWLRLSAAGLLSVAVFALILAWPWAGLEPFKAGLAYEWHHYDKGHDGFDSANSALDALGYLFRFALGPLACGVLVVGAILLARRPEPSVAARRVCAGAAGFVLIYLSLLSRQHLFFARVVAPMLPALALLVGVAAAALAQRLELRFGAKHRPLILTTLIGLVLLLPAVSTVGQVQAIRATDSRLLAYRWIDAKLREPELRLAAMPKSALAVIPEGIDATTVYRRVTVERLRQMNITHVIYGAGSIERFRWRPEDNVEDLAAWEDFHERLAAEATLIQRFEHAPMPDAEQFGDASRIYHHSAIEIWAID